MPAETTLLTLIISLTTGHILFLAFYLWVRAGKEVSNKILSLLLFCYALRIIKSVLLLAFPGLPIADILIVLGVIGMSAIGPLLWMYVQSQTKENFKIHSASLLHFIPAFILMPTAFFLEDKVMFHVYQFSVYQIIGYVVYSMLYFRKWKKTTADNNHKWINELFIAAGCLSVIFMIQLYTNSPGMYLVVSILAAIIFYTVSLRAAFSKNHSYPRLRKKPKAANDKLLPVIEEKFISDRLFLDPQMTVAKLALAMEIPAYTLSATINEESGMGFNEYLNMYRVREAAARLRSPEYELLSIEGIAYDCGFNSLSAFYNAFKKVFNTTPARYRLQSFPDSANQETLIGNTERL